MQPGFVFDRFFFSFFLEPSLNYVGRISVLERGRGGSGWTKWTLPLSRVLKLKSWKHNLNLAEGKKEKKQQSKTKSGFIPTISRFLMFSVSINVLHVLAKILFFYPGLLLSKCANLWNLVWIKKPDSDSEGRELGWAMVLYKQCARWAAGVVETALEEEREWL